MERSREDGAPERREEGRGKGAETRGGGRPVRGRGKRESRGRGKHEGEPYTGIPVNACAPSGVPTLQDDVFYFPQSPGSASDAGTPVHEPRDEEVAWGDEDTVNVAAFDGTAGLHGDFEESVGHAAARALEEGFEQQPVREALVPVFLRPGRDGPEVNADVQVMQRLKESALEFVRWRSTRVAADPGVEAKSGAVCGVARACSQELEAPCIFGLLRGVGGPGSASLSHVEFDGTQEFHNDLEGNVGPVAARAFEDGVEEQQVREALLPFSCVRCRRAPMSTWTYGRCSI